MCDGWRFAYAHVIRLINWVTILLVVFASYLHINRFIMSYYIKDSILPVDEDSYWEFKAHRNFSSDEVPTWRADGTKIDPSRAMAEFYKLKNADRTRQPISRNLSGFLNCGTGGKILIGVLDSGKVVGISLSFLQKDHLLLSLEDAMRRFIPRIPYEFIRVTFVPVIANESELQDLHSSDAKLCEPPFDLKQQPHQLRTSSLCWCDIQAMQRFKLGFMPTQYVVEITVAALHPRSRNATVSRVLQEMMSAEASALARFSWPAFTSEDGNIFVRVLNNLIKETKETIEYFNKFQTKNYVETELAALLTGKDENRNHLQSLMPPGVTVSEMYLKSILEDSEYLENVPPNGPLEDSSINLSHDFGPINETRETGDNISTSFDQFVFNTSNTNISKEENLLSEMSSGTHVEE